MSRARTVALDGLRIAALVVPADDAVCIWIPADDGAAGTCAATADAVAGTLSQVLDGDVSTVVADGAAPPELHGAAGARKALAVTDNVAYGRMRGAESLTVGAVSTDLTRSRG